MKPLNQPVLDLAKDIKSLFDETPIFWILYALWVSERAMGLDSGFDSDARLSMMNDMSDIIRRLSNLRLEANAIISESETSETT